jgi:hypothetical protein
MIECISEIDSENEFSCLIDGVAGEAPIENIHIKRLSTHVNVSKNEVESASAVSLKRR